MYSINVDKLKTSHVKIKNTNIKFETQNII